MSYVRSILQPGEEVRFSATIHWITYVKGLVFLILALVLFFYGLSINGGQGNLQNVCFGAAAALALIAAVLLLRAWFHRWITEIAVTNRRVIYKTGFISRKTNEMHMDKVESVRVEQSILGRLLGYGDVTVLGTGEGFETIRTIAHPLTLRNHITGT